MHRYTLIIAALVTSACTATHDDSMDARLPPTDSSSDTHVIGDTTQHPDSTVTHDATTASDAINPQHDSSVVIPDGGYMPPNPLVSRGRPVVDSTGMSHQGSHPINDGNYGTFGGIWCPGAPSVAHPISVTINVGGSLDSALLVWQNTYAPDYDLTSGGAPIDYEIQTSPTGLDNTWNTVATISHNAVRTREHRFAMTGQSYVRLVVTSAGGDHGGLCIDEIDIHDASRGTLDTWAYLGSGYTRAAFDRNSDHRQPSYASLVHTLHPDYFPVMLDAALLQPSVDNAVQNIDAWLALNPDINFWVLDYGENDAGGTDVAGFSSGLQTLVDRIKVAGHTPIIPHILFAADNSRPHLAMFNTAIDQLTNTNHLMAGPDLTTWFMNNTNELCGVTTSMDCEFPDHTTPTNQGMLSINRLWSDTTALLYPPTSSSDR